MKKITLLFALLVTSIGFSQTYDLLTNGDFENGTAPWVGNNFSVVAGEAFISTTNAGGDPWSTQLVHGSLEFENGKEYVLTFYARAAANRQITVAIQNVGAWTDQFRQENIDITTTMTEYTYTFNATSDNSNVQIGFLMAGFGSTDAIYYDDISLVTDGTPDPCANGVQDGDETGVDCGGSCPNACPSPPTVAATDPPARDAADVVSIFTNGVYADVTASGVNVFAGASLDNFTIVAADDTRRLTAPNPGGGAQYEYFGASPALDLTDFTHAHVDFYVEGAVAPGQLFQIFLLNFPNYPDGAGATNLNTSFDVNALGSGTWISGDVELAAFGGDLTRDKVALVQVVAAGAPAFGPIYIDNIYFHKNTVLGLNDLDAESFNVYPNPTENVWNVKTNNTIINSIQVVDILGKEVISLNPNSSEAQIDASTLNTGLYFARIESNSGIKTIKLIKN